MASLRELQRSFAAALREPARSCAVAPPANLAIYRNNSDYAFRAALDSSFPVVRRRVGEDYFRQLAHRYRERFPSRSGDLHWIGRDFAAFLAAELRGGDYEWLADLARLEWAREEAAVSVELEALGTAALGEFAPEQLERLVVGLQPSLRLISSPFPVLSVWFANQHENAPPVDQSLGSEQGLVRGRFDAVEVSRLAPDAFSYLSALSAGATLGEAMAATKVEGTRLTEILGLIFASNLVSSLTPRQD